MTRGGLVASVAMLMVSFGSLEGSELRPASLAGLSRLGAVIVTAASDTVPDDAVRRIVTRRLATGGVTIDDLPGPELIISVSAERGRAETGHCECGTFRVSISLREAVTLDRAPEAGPVAAITWSTSGRVRRYSTVAPRNGITDLIEEGMSAFLKAVASDSQQAEHEARQP